jgi:hypothetical protein
LDDSEVPKPTQTTPRLPLELGSCHVAWWLKANEGGELLTVDPYQASETHMAELARTDCFSNDELRSA